MPSEDWRRIEDLFHAALKREPVERSAFLIDACQGEEALRQRVEDLLLQDADAGELLSQPIDKVADELLSAGPSETRLALGSMAGPYRIGKQLGAGGMGEVYLAEDTRLNRTVAVKTLKARFTERFQREARAISALNHPNICTLYDIGSQDGVGYLVMEYVDGEPLKGPLKIAEALRLAIQIASALEAAHAKGILHRDLKPGNILVSKTGVKLLDFGLAKFMPGAPRPVDVTVTASMTGTGQILGTLAYMSPEQIEAKPADARSDIFSFGLVLYEMLTGRRAFQAPGHASLIAAILKEEPPPLSTEQPSISPALERTVNKCLAKEPARRWQTAADLRDELAWIADSSSAVTPALVSRRSFFPWIAGAAAGAGATGLTFWTLGRKGSQAPTEATRFRLAPPEGQWIARSFTRQSLALSPVGRRLAMIAAGERGSMVWVQRLDSLTAKPLPGTEGASMVFWSPDGAIIGFWAGGKLQKIPAEGGTPLPICDLPRAWSATWNEDNLIVAQIAYPGDSVRISVQSGAVSPAGAFNWPKFLPGGKHLLYVNTDLAIKGLRAYVTELSTGRQTELMPTDTQVTFTPDQPGSSQGRLLFGRNATLQALRFDAERLSIMGEPVPVAKDVPFFGGLGWSEFDTSLDGILIHSTGSQEAQLTWVDRRGRDLSQVGVSRDFFGFFRLSPDGKKVAADIFDFAYGGTDIWICDVSQATIERATLDPGAASPVWSPAGTKIAYGRGRNEPLQLKMKPTNDQGPEQAFPRGVFQLPCDWSSDGRWIFYQTSGGEGDAEIWIASLADRKVMPLLQTRFDTSFPALSPNGEYLAFSANDTGRSEIYVQRFQGNDPPKLAGEPRRISREGGIGPRWRHDGKELFFLSPDRRIMAAAVNQDSGMESDAPEALFPLPTSFRSLAPITVGYDVSSDGQKFLVPVRKAAGAPLQVVVNWQAALKS